MTRFGNVKRVWTTAHDEVRESEPDLDDQIEYWEGNHPGEFDLAGFYETYVWAVYFTGMKVAVIEALAGRIRDALRQFDVDAIAADPEVVREELLAVIGHRQKASAAISTALRLQRCPEEWERLKRLPLTGVLDQLLTYAYIGPQNRYHIARNLGWDVAMTGGFTGALAENLGTTSGEIIGALARAAGKRLNTTDIVIGSWSRLHRSEEECIGRIRALLGR